MDETISRYGDAPEAEAAEKEAKKDGKELRSSGQTARMLGLIAYLVNQQPAVKAAFLHVCQPRYDQRGMLVLLSWFGFFSLRSLLYCVVEHEVFANIPRPA